MPYPNRRRAFDLILRRLCAMPFPVSAYRFLQNSVVKSTRPTRRSDGAALYTLPLIRALR